MATILTLDPITRLEEHLRVDVAVEGGHVVEARASRTLSRRAKAILANRNPWDAPHFAHHICGVYPIPHALAAVLAFERAANSVVPPNGRLLRNLVLAAHFIQSHLLHFYQLTALDYVEGPAMAPWQTGWTGDRRFKPETTKLLVGHYVEALAMTRKAHEMGAIFGGRTPLAPAYIPGGFTGAPRAGQVVRFRTYCHELLEFIENVYLPDVEALASVYDDYSHLGRGYGNLLSFGVFELSADGSHKLFRPGHAAGGSTLIQSVNASAVTERVTCSWDAGFTNNLNPTNGAAVLMPPKDKTFSWLKCPRYGGQPCETGPLARMWVNGDYHLGISVMDRHRARALETLKIAYAMLDWLDQLVIGQSPCSAYVSPQQRSGVGLTEAPSGALGHWLKILEGKISRYEIITPESWNASPTDNLGQRGPLEQALLGTPVRNSQQPIEVLRIVHSFHPCFCCVVHVLRPKSDARITTCMANVSRKPAPAPVAA